MGDAVLRRPADDLAPKERRSSGEREADPAAHGSDADLPEAQYKQASQGTQDLAISAQEIAGGTAEPGLSVRHHVFADASWFLYLVAIMDWFARKVLA